MSKATGIPAIGHATCGGHVTLLFTVEDSEIEPYYKVAEELGCVLIPVARSL